MEGNNQRWMYGASLSVSDHGEAQGDTEGTVMWAKEDRCTVDRSLDE